MSIYRKGNTETSNRSNAACRKIKIFEMFSDRGTHTHLILGVQTMMSTDRFLTTIVSSFNFENTTIRH